jgi:anti-sigma factor RsiW
MTLRCQEALERLVEGLTGSVPPAEREAVVEHLATCVRCSDEAAHLEELAGQLRQTGHFSAPPGFWPEFMNRLDERITLERLPASVRFRRWFVRPRSAMATMAATVAAALVISTAVRLGPRHAAEPDPVLIEARGLVTETMTTTLPSLGEMIDVWRAGLTTESETLLNGTERRTR